MGDAEQSVVQQMPAEMLRPGYTVWAPEDGDWLKVREVHHDEEAGEVTVYRTDRSEAVYRAGREVLVRVEPPGPPTPPKPPSHRPVG